MKSSKPLSFVTLVEKTTLPLKKGEKSIIPQKNYQEKKLSIIENSKMENKSQKKNLLESFSKPKTIYQKNTSVNKSRESSLKKAINSSFLICQKSVDFKKTQELKKKKSKISDEQIFVLSIYKKLYGKSLNARYEELLSKPYIDQLVYFNHSETKQASILPVAEVKKINTASTVETKDLKKCNITPAKNYAKSNYGINSFLSFNKGSETSIKMKNNQAVDFESGNKKKRDSEGSSALKINK